MALSLQSLGKGLYTKTTLELGVEKSIADSQAKLAVLSSLDKAGVEVRECKRFGIKRKRVEVKNYEDFIESLESYAKLSNQPLTVEQVYFALKDLEKGAESELKEKIRAIRKEVGKKERISSRKIVYASALGILGLAAFATWYLNQDHKAPEIEKVDYKDRVNKGEEQEISVKVFEDNPGEAFLKFNSSSIQIPLAQKFDNGTALYKTSFDPASVLAREGLLNAELVVKDKAGNEAKQSLSFLANLQAPVLKDLSIEKVDLGKYKISLAIEEDNLKEAYVSVGGRRIPLNKHGDKLFGQVDLGCNTDFEVKAEDVFGLKTSLPASAVLSEADKLELSLYCSSNLFREIYSKDKALANSILDLAKRNGSAIPKNIVYQVLDQIERDSRAKDKVGTASKSFDILSNLKIYGLKNRASVYIPGNYSLAVIQGLPEHSSPDIKRIFDASEKCSDIVDFEPIIIKDVTGQTIRIESKNLARDYWMIAELLKNRPEIASQTKKFEWINRMVQQVAWDIFDDEYGPSFYDKKTYKPTDSEVWQVILGFHDYMDSLPAKLERDGIGIIFPYHDSGLLRQYIADKTNRTIALFYLADLPPKTIDKEFARKYVEEYRAKGGKGYPSDLVEKSLRKGIEGMKKFVEQLPIEHEEIRRIYSNPSLDDNAAARFVFYEWLIDRGGHGLANTVDQYIGGWSVLRKAYYDQVPFPWPREWHNMLGKIENAIRSQNGIDQFLLRNWKPWDLIKFIYGCERFKPEWGGEWEMYRYGLPLAFKALGIPFGGIRINPDTYLINQGAPIYEWGVSLPDNIIERSKQTFLNYNIILDYGNIISLYSFVDGLLKDSDNIEYIMGGIRVPIYLWKK